MFYLNGIQIPEPDEFETTDVEISKTATMSSGKKVKQVISVKRNFDLQYENMEYSDLANILSIIESANFVPFKYIENEIEKTYTVWVNPIKKKLKITDPEYGGKYWGDIRLELEEQ